MSSLRIVVLLFLLTLVSGSDASAKPPGSGWVPFEPMTDEFNGEQLDESKWHPNNPKWKGRNPVYFHPKAKRLQQGMLRLASFKSGDSAKLNLPPNYSHASGYIRSKASARFGYFEARLKTSNGPLVSCFWLSRHDKQEWSEIDIIEAAAGNPQFANKMPTNVHYFYGPHYRGNHQKHLVDPESVELPFRTADKFHVYGLEWTPTVLRWYVDDKKVRETTNKHNFQPLEMSINLEANKWFNALPDDRRMPGDYRVDWVRAWRRADGPGHPPAKPKS